MFHFSYLGYINNSKTKLNMARWRLNCPIIFSWKWYFLKNFQKLCLLKKVQGLVHKKWHDTVVVNHFSQTRKKIWVCRTTFLQPEKMWIYSINPPFFWSTTFLEPEKKSKFEEPFFSNQISRTRFLKPDFSNQISQTTFLHLSRKVVAD